MDRGNPNPTRPRLGKRTKIAVGATASLAVLVGLASWLRSGGTTADGSNDNPAFELNSEIDQNLPKTEQAVAVANWSAEVPNGDEPETDLDNQDSATPSSAPQSRTSDRSVRQTGARDVEPSDSKGARGRLHKLPSLSPPWETDSKPSGSMGDSRTKRTSADLASRTGSSRAGSESKFEPLAGGRIPSPLPIMEGPQSGGSPPAPDRIGARPRLNSEPVEFRPPTQVTPPVPLDTPDSPRPLPMPAEEVGKGAAAKKNGTSSAASKTAKPNSNSGTVPPAPVFPPLQPSKPSAAMNPPMPSPHAPAGVGAGVGVVVGDPTALAPVVGAGAQQIAPIDLVSAMRLAGCRDLDVALARERLAKALAELDKAKGLWLPSMYLGAQFVRQDGSAQFVGGEVQNVNKNSFHLGLTAAGGASGSGPIPAGGPIPTNGLSSILRISDAIFEPLAARQVAAARRAAIQTASNDALLGVAESYVALQDASGRVAIVQESLAKFDDLIKLLEAQTKLDAQLEYDLKRVQTERLRQQGSLDELNGLVEQRSTDLARRLRLDPRVVLTPVEPAQTVLTIAPTNIGLDDLVVIALRTRPELGEAQWLVQATLSRLKQAKLRPFIPSLAMRFSGGGFGGGPNDFFGNFNARGDTDIALFWQIENLGVGDKARMRDRAAEQRSAVIQLMKVQDQIAAEVVSESKAKDAAGRKLQTAGQAVQMSRDSVDSVVKWVKNGQRDPWEAVQAIETLAASRVDHLDAVSSQNKAQFRLHRALGQPITAAASEPGPSVSSGHGDGPVQMIGPDGRPMETESVSPSSSGASSNSKPSTNPNVKPRSKPEPSSAPAPTPDKPKGSDTPKGSEKPASPKRISLEYIDSGANPPTDNRALEKSGQPESKPSDSLGQPKKSATTKNKTKTSIDGRVFTDLPDASSRPGDRSFRQAGDIR